MHDVRLDTLGRLVENQQVRAQCKRPADGQLLLLSAGQISATTFHHLFQHREQVKDHVRYLARFVASRRQADLQVLRHCQLGKYFSTLWHVTDADSRALLSAATCKIGTDVFDRATGGG